MEPGNEAKTFDSVHSGAYECGKALVHCSLVPRLSSVCERSLGTRVRPLTQYTL